MRQHPRERIHDSADRFRARTREGAKHWPNTGGARRDLATAAAEQHLCNLCRKVMFHSKLREVPALTATDGTRNLYGVMGTYRRGASWNAGASLLRETLVNGVRACLTGQGKRALCL